MKLAAFPPAATPLDASGCSSPGDTAHTHVHTHTLQKAKKRKKTRRDVEIEIETWERCFTPSRHVGARATWRDRGQLVRVRKKNKKKRPGMYYILCIRIRVVSGISC